MNKFAEFTRDFFGSGDIISTIGSGSAGGKASGLALLKKIIDDNIEKNNFPGSDIDIPRFTVLLTDNFDSFIKRNNLLKFALEEPDNDKIIREFHKASLPAEIVGDLRALINKVHTPLAVRSSSMLEDSLEKPFAGIYETKMIANNSPSQDERFRILSDAVKFVYASTYFRAAKGYFNAIPNKIEDEKMAVIIQEVAGDRHYERFYPDLSGVARSFNYYPTGKSKPEYGVVSLALGLGKTIVDGGITWSYSPKFPRATPPFAGPKDMMKNTQTTFWAVNMSQATNYSPLGEKEFLVNCNLNDAEYDGTLERLASTYNASSDRIVIGTGIKGPRILNFAPLLDLNQYGFNKVIPEILRVCEENSGAAVEIEFAARFDTQNDLMKLSLLQLRPMFVPSEAVKLSDEEMNSRDNMLSSDRVLGNGITENITDILYVKKSAFDISETAEIALELEEINKELVAKGTHVILIGFGRWGSSDKWLGIPVDWGQIASAKAIVELTLPEINVDLSQGSHFFHNITCFNVSYFSIRHDGDYTVDWDWIENQETVSEKKFIKHVRTKKPLTIIIDGRQGKGVIKK